MATFDFPVYCYTPGQLWTEYLKRVFFSDELGSWAAPGDVELGNYDGHRCIRIVREVGDNTSIFHIVLMTAPTSSILPVRYLLESSGFNSNLLVNLRLGESSLSAFLALWASRVSTLKAELVEAWSAGTPGGVATDSINLLDDEYGNALASFHVTTVSEILLTTDSVTVFIGVSVTSHFGTAAPVCGPLSVSPLSVVVALDTGGLVRAVGDLANRDVVFSNGNGGPWMSFFGRSAGS